MKAESQRVAIGLALVLAFLFTTNAWAGLVRIGEQTPDGWVATAQLPEGWEAGITFEFGVSTAPPDLDDLWLSGNMWVSGGGDAILGIDYDLGNFSLIGYTPPSGTIWLDLEALGDNLVGFSLEWTGVKHNSLFNGLSVNGEIGSGLKLWGNEADIMYHDITQIDLLANLIFRFGQGIPYDETYTITLYHEPGASSVPEPGTLAILGLGLAGLGLARMRRRK